MKNLLGEDFDEAKYFDEAKPIKTKETIKEGFRRIHRYKAGYLCKNCDHFLEGKWRDKKYFKCIKIGLSHSEATDIRKSDVACNLYKEREDE